MTATVEVLASRSHKGTYDFWYDTRLVRRKGKSYLVHDSFCGMDSLEGGCPRPFVYEVPEGRVGEVQKLIEDDDREYINLVLLGQLRCLGRKSKLRWAADL